MRELHGRYAGTDVILIGVHSPEFDREKDIDAVRAATARFGIEYPVVVDNDWVIWRGFDNRYWPALYLIDKQGVIRGRHAGEMHTGTAEWEAWIGQIEGLRVE